MIDVQLLSKLVNAPAPSGFEDMVRGIIVEALEDAGFEPQSDQLGNTYVVLGEGRPLMILAAHMDEVGFIVRYVDERGFLRIIPLGGVRAQMLPGSEVVVIGEKLIPGIIGSEPPHTGGQAQQVTFENLYVDIGVSSREEAEELGVKPGTPLTFAGNFRDWGRRVSGKALDDRIGCYALIEALRGASAPATGSVVVAFTVQEEVGTRGAAALASSLNPNFGVAVEGTIANDTPGVAEDKIVTRLGGGAAIRLLDRSMIASRRLAGHLVELAESNSIRYQVQVSPYGGTDAGRFLVAGAETAGVSVPSRYIHSPVSLADKLDVEEAVKLLRLVMENPWP